MPDLCVIGADAAALATASAAAAFGVSVVLVENTECGALRDSGTPLSKALLAAAAHINAMHAGARFGVKSVRFGVDFNAVRAHVRGALDAIATAVA
jgi:pyruvate/2-oxoglutarate dehydrogenase complex dihydrolipoamide dehydrogenase (E3) component